MLNSDFNLEEPKHKHSSGNLLKNINLGRFDKRWELLIFPLICILASWLALSQTLQVNLWVLIGVITIPIAVTSLYRPDIGLLCLLSIAFVLPGLEKIAGLTYARLSFDVLWMVNIVGTFLYLGRTGKLSQLKHPLGVAVAIWIVYNLILSGSHMGTDQQVFWGSIEKYVLPGFMLWVGMTALGDFKRIRLFTHFLLGLGVFVALYGWIQGFTGISMRESSELFANPSLYESYFVNGKFRIDSFFTTPSQLGMAMASLSVFAYVNLLGPWKKNYLISYLLALPVLVGAMVLSRTTSAYIVIGIGLLLFLSLTLKKHLLWSLLCLALVGLGFYSLTSSYLSEHIFPSAISHSQAFQHISSSAHLFGQSTTHPSVGVIPGITPGEIGGYAQLLKETGWIGLSLFFGLLTMICWVGVKGFSKSIDVRVKNTYLVYLVSIVLWIIGNYFYPILTEIPISIVFILSAAVLVNLGEVEHDSP